MIRQLLGIACLAAPAVVRAQEAILVTATRTGEGGASGVTTVSSDAIARLQPVSLIEALNDVAGVRAVSTGGVGGGSFVSIRGGEPNFTLVLLDGVRVNDPTNSKGGAFDFTLIDPSLVRAVEVSRGASSAVHGSDALSGVINIRLAEPETAETAVRALADARGQVGGGISFADRWDGGGLLLAAGAHDSNDADPGSTLRRAQGLARIHQRVGDFDALALGVHARNSHRAIPEDSGGPALAVLRDRERGTGELWNAAFAVRRLPGASVRPELSLSYSRQESHVNTPAIAPGVLDGVPAIEARNRLSRFEATGDVVIASGPFVATVGAAVLDERGHSRGAIDFGFPVPTDFRLHRRTTSGFAEAALAPARGLTVNAAVRYDDIADGGEWTGRAGIAFSPIAGGPALFARIGEGFKLPSFYALGHPLVGNPELRPERSRNVEAGAEWSPEPGLQGRLAWFDNRFTDLVDFDPVSFRNVNRTNVRARGLEAEGTWQVTPGWQAGAALTFLDLDSPLRARPRWQGNLRSAWRPVPTLELGALLRFNSRFYDSSVPTGLVTTNGHAEVDASLRYAISTSLKLDVALRNIGNIHDWSAVGFPSPGRTLRAALSASF